MKKRTQEQFVANELLDNKQISRNLCLKNFITRLGARISDLKEEGWKIDGKFIKTEYGKDYVYYLVEAPYRKVEYRVEGQVVSSGYEKIR